MEADESPLYTLDSVDDATATLILQLQNRDVEELVHASKGKSQDGKPSDADLAVEIYQRELREMRTVGNQNFAKSSFPLLVSAAKFFIRLG